MKTGCVIMASGWGRRFGGNKLLADFGGRPLISWIFDATEDIFAKRVVVTRYQEIENFCRERQIPVIFHQMPERNDTVRLGLESLKEDVGGCMFCAGDQPLLKKKTLQRLIAAASEKPEYIWQLSDGVQAGAPVLFPAWSYPELLTLPSGKGGNVVMKAHPESVKTVVAESPLELRDVDTPQALTALLEAGYLKG